MGSGDGRPTRWRGGALIVAAFLAAHSAQARAETSAAVQLPAYLPAVLDCGAPNLDAPIALMRLAAERIGRVRDYTALLLREERLGGKLTPVNYIQLKIRHEPFSVYMKWVKPGPNAEREVIYVDGQNDGRVLVHDGGVVGLIVKKFTFAVDDPVLRRESLYPITQAGIKDMADRMSKVWPEERRYKETVVTTSGDAEVAGRLAWFVKLQNPRDERTASLKFGGKHIYHKIHCWVDKELLVPVRFEAYDWPEKYRRPAWDLLKILPKKDLPRDGAMICRYTYQGLKFDAGLTDSDFDWRNPKYNFR